MCNIDVLTLTLYHCCCNIVDYATNNQLHPKTCQKPYAKTPQKPHKNLVRKNPAKIFYDFLNKKPAKNFKYIQKLPNFTLNTNKTKNPCTN
jgi:hypothetical protein